MVQQEGRARREGQRLAQPVGRRLRRGPGRRTVAHDRGPGHPPAAGQQVGQRVVHRQHEVGPPGQPPFVGRERGAERSGQARHVVRVHVQVPGVVDEAGARARGQAGRHGQGQEAHRVVHLGAGRSLRGERLRPLGPHAGNHPGQPQALVKRPRQPAAALARSAARPRLAPLQAGSERPTNRTQEPWQAGGRRGVHQVAGHAGHQVASGGRRVGPAQHGDRVAPAVQIGRQAPGARVEGAAAVEDERDAPGHAGLPGRAA